MSQGNPDRYLFLCHQYRITAIAKVTLPQIQSGYRSSTAFNSDLAAIEAAIENTLSRDGTSPNQMEASLDMNGEQIINLPAPVDDNDPVRLQDIDAFMDATELAADAAEAAQAAAEAAAASAEADADDAANILAGLIAGTYTQARLLLGGTTVTADTPLLSGTQTWNNGAVTFNGFKLNITNTASASGSKLLDLQVGGSSYFKVVKDGSMVAGAYGSTTQDAGFTMSRNMFDGTTNNGHGFVAIDYFRRGGNSAYAAFDAATFMVGNPFDHWAAFQDRGNFQAGSVGQVMADMFGLYTQPFIDAGKVTRRHGVYIAAPVITGGGTIDNQYGLYCSALTGATNNFAIYTTGVTKSYFQGKVGFGTETPASQVSISAAPDDNNGLLKLQTASAADNAGMTFWCRASGASANSRNWQISNNYAGFGNLDIFRSTSNSNNPTTRVASFDYNNNFDVDGTIRTKAYTVATLPSAVAGTRAYVTDANATTYASIVAGGGSNGVPVYKDSANWRIG